ncbi:MAG: alpha/beta hydrolase [Patescibacteria group bacterium]
MNMNCIIIHGGPGDEKPSIDHKMGEMHWMGWAKERLNSLGIETTNPAMPDPWNPRYEDYKKEFEKFLVDENTILIGHSRGCAFLVHWLGDSKQKIKKLILVAPWKVSVDDIGEEKLKTKFYDFKIDPSIKDRAGEIVYFTSNDEDIEGKESLKIYHDAIGGKIIELPNHGHYTLEDMGTDEFPELIDATKTNRPMWWGDCKK